MEFSIDTNKLHIGKTDIVVETPYFLGEVNLTDLFKEVDNNGFLACCYPQDFTHEDDKKDDSGDWIKFLYEAEKIYNCIPELTDHESVYDEYGNYLGIVYYICSDQIKEGYRAIIPIIILRDNGEFYEDGSPCATPYAFLFAKENDLSTLSPMVFLLKL